MIKTTISTSGNIKQENFDQCKGSLQYQSYIPESVLNDKSGGKNNTYVIMWTNECKKSTKSQEKTMYLGFSLVLGPSSGEFWNETMCCVCLVSTLVVLSYCCNNELPIGEPTMFYK